MTVRSALVAAAGFGLGQEQGRSTMELADCDVDELLAAATWHRITGLLIAALDHGRLTGPPRLEEAARAAHHDQLHATLLAEHAALIAIEALEAAGIRSLLLKGLATAHLDYPDPSWRLVGDADLLIRRADHRAALQALDTAGFERVRPPVRSWWERRFAKAVTMQGPAGSELDLHLALTGGYFGTVLDHHRLWAEQPSTFTLADRQVNALGAPDRLLHACLHTILGDHSGLRSRRDIAQLIVVGDADWRSTVDLAGANRAVDVVAAAIDSTWTELRLAEHDASIWARAHRTDPHQQRAIADYAETHATEWGPEGLTTIAALGPLDRIAYLAGLAAPSRSSLAARGRSRTEHLQRGFGVIRRNSTHSG